MAHRSRRHSRRHRAGTRRVLHIAPEVFPIVKTGGLGDVLGALPQALRHEGCPSRMIIPGYPSVLDAMSDVRLLTELRHGDRRHIHIEHGAVASFPRYEVWEGRLEGLPGVHFVIDCPKFYDREGGPYVDANGQAHADNPIRFALLGRVAADLALGYYGHPVADVLHAHDWQGALALCYVHAHKYSYLWPAQSATTFNAPEAPATVLTIHNLGYQGRFNREVFPLLGLPQRMYAIDGVEFWGDVNFLKGGIQFADHVTTVSPTYAREIQDEHGAGLEGVLSHRSAHLSGILNGIDTKVWDPASDPFLPAHYSAGDMEGKAICKAKLQEAFDLPVLPNVPVIGVVSRLVPEKGIDLLLAAVRALRDASGQLVVLGRGDGAIESMLADASAAHPETISVKLTYDEGLAHLIQAGADVMAVPSRIEPCGLTQMYAMRYGTLPLVRRTGGLSDSVVNATWDAIDDEVATGFVFNDATQGAVAGTVRWLVSVYRDRDTWRELQRNAMAQDFSWSRAAATYADLYRRLTPWADV